MGNTMYQDGDIPRKYMSIPSGPSQGWSYYKSSEKGDCNNCQSKTSYWYVAVNCDGKFICKDCRLNGR